MSIFRSYLPLEEEMSISNDVVDVSKRIKNICIEKLSKAPLKSSNDFNRFFKRTEFDVPVDGLIPNVNYLHIKLMCYIFKTVEEYNANKITLDTNCSSDYDKLTIVLKLVLIGGKPNEDFDSSIQHEVNHIFQYANGASKNENLYEKAVNVCSNKNSTYNEKVLAYLLYLAFRTKQDSFVNQYYAYLKQNNVSWDEVYDYFPDDDGNPYSKFLDYYYEVSEMNISDDEIKNLFGITKKQYMIRIYNSDKRMRNKMMKAAAKYRRDITNENFYLKDVNRMSFILESLKNGINIGSDEYDE